MKSKSIKLQITNNHSHHHSITLGHNDSHPFYQPSDELQTVHYPPSQSSVCSHTHPMCLSSFQQQSISEDQIKSMYTIRQEESYEYQSDLGSICFKNKLIESRIDQFSTIRADDNKENYHYNFMNLKGSKFLQTFSSENPNRQFGGILSQNNSKQGSKLREYQTTGSINTVKNSMEEVNPHIEAWEQKINTKILKQNDEQQEQILQEKMLVLTQTQKSLKLNKSKIPPFEIQMKGNQKIKKGYDIVYNCSDRQLEQIIKILEKQGVRLIKRQNQLFREKIQPSETSQKVNLNILENINANNQSLENKQKQKKKLKIKMIKTKNKKTQQPNKQQQNSD